MHATFTEHIKEACHHCIQPFWILGLSHHHSCVRWGFCCFSMNILMNDWCSSAKQISVSITFFVWECKSPFTTYILAEIFNFNASFGKRKWWGDLPSQTLGHACINGANHVQQKGQHWCLEHGFLGPVLAKVMVKWAWHRPNMPKQNQKERTPHQMGFAVDSKRLQSHNNVQWMLQGTL